MKSLKKEVSLLVKNSNCVFYSNIFYNIESKKEQDEREDSKEPENLTGEIKVSPKFDHCLTQWL